MKESYQLPEEITISTVGELYHSLMERTRQDELLEVNAADVHRFDGAGLQCLFQLWQTGQIVVVNPADDLCDAAMMMGLGNEFLVH